MQLPLQVSFRGMDASEAMEQNIRESAAKLNQYSDQLISCRVMVEAQHRHHQKGNLYHVRIDLTVPNHEIVVSRAPGEHQSHSDAYVAIRDAFDAAKRQLKEWNSKRQQHVKTHAEVPYGSVAELFPAMDYGTIRAPDGREIYFHRNSVLNGDFETLAIGDAVRFAETAGDNGPQASTVHVEGKH